MKVGIDLGTTYSSVAYVNNDGTPIVIDNENNKPSTPSIVAFDGNDILFGEAAREIQALGSDNVASAFKRRMGSNDILIEYDSKGYTAEDLSALFLKHIISEAEKKVGQRIDSAVITVPAYFNDLQRTATIRAGERAGIKVLKIVNEPTAAAFSYGMTKNLNGKMMVFDLGGGTFDITIFRTSANDIEVIATDGNSNLGGKDWDHAMLDHIANLFQEEFDIDPREDPAFMSEFIVESEKYKKNLSSADKINVRINYGGFRGNYSITAEEFESLTAGIVDSVIGICNKLLDEIGYNWNSFDSILLTGGSTRLPAIRRALRECTSVPLIIHEDTDIAVAKGAALFAAAIERRPIRRLGGGDSDCDSICKKRIVDVTAHSLGTVAVSPDETRYVNEIILKRNTKVPCSQRKPFVISPGNRTDVLEIYTLQGEEDAPLDCTILAKVTASGIVNDGKGVEVDIEFSYNTNGVVEVKAYQGSTALKITSDRIPDDISWMGEPYVKPKSMAKPTHICMSVDLSGSMCADDAKEKAADAMMELVRKLPNASFSLTEFGDKGKIVLKKVDQQEALKRIPRICSDNVGAGTSHSPFKEIYECLRPSLNEEKCISIILTDGQWYGYSNAVKESRRCIDEGIDIIALGFGDADNKFLKSISNTDESGLTDLSTLTETFSTIATAIDEGRLRMR